MKTRFTLRWASRLAQTSFQPPERKLPFKKIETGATPVLLWLALLLAPLSAGAQIVADGASLTLSNVTNNITGDVIVGTNGSFTLLVLSDNALLTNSVNGHIGRNATAKSNEVRLISGTAQWRMGGSLFVGSNGSMSRLVVSNGAMLEDFNGSLGFATASSNNAALITGPGSLWTNRGSFSISSAIFSSSRSNRLVVSNSAALVSASAGVGGFGNQVLITGAGSRWISQSDFSFGGTANRLDVSNGAGVVSSNGTLGDLTSGGTNTVLLTGTGTFWTNNRDLTISFSSAPAALTVNNGAGLFVGNSAFVGQNSGANFNSISVSDSGTRFAIGSDLYVGSLSSANSLAISNGGFVVSSNAYVGGSLLGASGNSALVVGAGSVWSNRNFLYIGDADRDNRLVASNGAAVSAGNRTYIGVSAGANFNSVMVTDTGSSFSVSDYVYVGSNGVANQFVVSNGATVGIRVGYVGYGSAGKSNVVLVTGPGSAWASQEILLGYMGAANQLIVSNGANVSFETGNGSAFLGYFVSASNTY